MTRTNFRRHHLLAPSLLLCAAAFAGCGGEDEPIHISSPVGITMDAEPGDVENGVITVDKNINSESGNPWAAFVADSEAELGRAPSDIDIESLDLLLASSSEGYTQLREIFSGTVDVQFEMNSTGTFVPVASVEIDETTEGREVSFRPSFDFADLEGEDLANFMNGSFKVVMSGPAASGFEAADGKAETQLTFTFSAFE